MKKNKKMTLVASALAVSGVLAGMVIATNGVSAIIAEENTHVHGDNCIIHHYAAISPTASKAGVKEYWICCNDPNHSISFEAPTTGQITDATHTSDFTVTADDPRYIAPYTFPEVFSTPWAYDTAVTVEEGKVKSLTNKIHIKGSVLKEAYELGYTHFKLHSYADGENVEQIKGTQDIWTNYFKQYKNDNDNRFWLKSFSDKTEGLYITAKAAEDKDAAGSITLSNFQLFKSSITETWGSGQMTGWTAVTDANKYIAYENGELVFDNAGMKGWQQAGAIPSSMMGEAINREFYVKILAEGFFQANQPQNTRIVVADKTGAPAGYDFQASDGSKKETDDGFVSPTKDGKAFGLIKGNYYEGDLAFGLDYPGAFAVRINYDFLISYTGSGVKSKELMPLASSTNVATTRISLQNITYAEGADNQINLQLPNSKKHKGMKLKMIWNDSSKPQDNVPVLSFNEKDVLWWVTYSKVNNYYEAAAQLTFKDENPGATIALRPETVGTDPTTITFEYSWID